MRILLPGGQGASPKVILMAIHRTVHLLPLDRQACLGGRSGGKEVETASKC